MRGRIWIFAVLVAAALALHLALLSAKVAQTGEDNVRAHLALSTSALRSQLELLDARLSPRAVAALPDLVEATRAPPDPAEPLPRPDERALRAAASVVSPEPDLVAVVNRQGGIVSRRARPAQTLDDSSRLPLARAALEGSPAPVFAAFDGAVYRIAAARVPGNGAAALLGTVVDDRFAAQLKSQVDADVTLLQGGNAIASSLPQGEARTRLLRWASAPSPGYGVLPIHLPFVGDALSGKLPRGATRYAVRGALLTLDSGVQAALTVPAAPYLAWLGRYQAFYAAGFGLFVLFSLVWGLLARAPRAAAEPAPPPVPEDTVGPVMRQQRPSAAIDAAEAESSPAPAGDVPWPSAEAAEAPPPAPPGSEPEPLPVVGNVDAPEPAVVAPPPPIFGNGAPQNDPGFAAAAGDAPQKSEGAAAETPFPGDEPTRIEPVSAALLDKLREHEDAGPADTGQDPDEQHWRETFDQFRELKTRLGEAADRISFEKFAAKLKKNRADLLARHNCKGVRFSVYEKDGKAAIKASAIR